MYYILHLLGEGNIANDSVAQFYINRLWLISGVVNLLLLVFYTANEETFMVQLIQSTTCLCVCVFVFAHCMLRKLVPSPALILTSIEC